MKRFTIILTATLFSTAFFYAQSAAKWAERDVVQPGQVAARLSDGKQAPLILMVGFPNLYKTTHLPGAVFAGPAFNAQGLEVLKKAVANVPRDREIVVYCACCPWDHCPNVHPAFDALHTLGFKNVKAMVIEKNLETDWIKKGYPTETGSAGGR